jgi:hypothetical protein
LQVQLHVIKHPQLAEEAEEAEDKIRDQPQLAGGGGSGSTGGFITIFANIITNLNVESIG